MYQILKEVKSLDKTFDLLNSLAKRNENYESDDIEKYMNLEMIENLFDNL